MKCYYGEVHAHTDFSDGRGTPPEAYDYARNVGKVDYFSVTDHNFPKLTDEKYYSVMPALAEEKNEDGKFAALHGYEMTYGAPSGYYGHANIIPPKQIFRTKLSLDEWYDAMASIDEDGVGQFNHPGDKWGNFNDFKYDPRMDKIFSIMEIRITEYGISCIEEEYDRALRMGWHISPVSNEDTHGANWTTSREETGAVLAEELTRENILNAMRLNRTYATTDRSLKLFYKANGEWMGARLKKTGALKVEIDASTEKECGLGVLQLVGEHNVVLAQIDVGSEKSYRWEITIPDDQRYVYVKRISAMHYAISGAIFVEQNAPVDVEIRTGYQNGKLVATAAVKNNGSCDLSNVTVAWTPACVSIEQSRPSYTSVLGAVKAGESSVAGYTSPILPEVTRLVVSVRGECNGETVAVNRVVYISALSITQYFTNTMTHYAQGFTKQPFCCFDLYNHSDTEIDVSAYQFRLYNCGLHQEFRVPRKIAPHGMLTVWLHGQGNSNTLDDFNEYFGTTLTEDQVYLCSEKLNAEDATRKLAICYGDEVICRAYVRGDGYHGAEVQPKGCFRYKWTQDCATMEVLELRSAAMPQESFTFEESVVTLPEGEALATYAPVAEKPINRLVVFTDGCTDLAGLEAKARRAVPEAKEIIMVAGTNDGSKGLHAYLYNQGGDLFEAALKAEPDAVLFAVGANDCGKKRSDWFNRNFVSYSTVMVNTTRSFYVRNIPLLFTTPIMTEEQKPEENMLVHNMKMVAETLGGKMVEMPEEIIPAVILREEKKITPRADAVRVAIIGDQFCEGSSEIPAYGSLLQRVLGEGYEVRIFSKNKARAAQSNVTNYLRYAEENVKAMKKFAPDVIVSWFGLADLSRENASSWETYKVDFIKGYNEIIETFTAWGAKMIMIAPFARTIEDVRKTVILQEGGMKDTVKEIAEANSLPLVDFFTPTVEQAGLVIIRKKLDTVSEEGTRVLSDMVADAIKNI